MSILFAILIGLAGLIGLILIIALFVKKEYSIEETIVINKPRQDVFDYVKFLKNQEHFSKWVMMDPQKKTTFTGTDGSVGFIYAWDSQNKQAGKGEQEIIGLVNGEEVDVEVRFERPFTNTAKTPFTLETISGDQTRLTWGMKGKNAYPMNLMTAVIAGALAKDLATSLQNLKTILENK